MSTYRLLRTEKIEGQKISNFSGQRWFGRHAARPERRAVKGEAGVNQYAQPVERINTGETRSWGGIVERAGGRIRAE